MASINALLTLNDISLYNENFEILSKINLSLFPSEIHCILGKYGSGKSELARVLRGRLRPGKGFIEIDNKKFSWLKIKDSIKLGIAVFQHEDLFQENIKAKEYLYDKYYSHNLTILSVKKIDSYYSQVAEKYSLTFSGNCELGELTISEKYYLGIVRILEKNPKIIVLDEILDKLDKRFLIPVMELLEEKKRQGSNILIITNNIDEVYNIAERVSIIKNGRIIYTDFVKEIEKINLIKLAYAEISQTYPEDEEDFYHLLKYNEAILLELPLNLIIIDKNMKVKIANRNACEFYRLKNTHMESVMLEDLFKGNQHVFKVLKKAFQQREAKVIYNSVLSFNNSKLITNIKTYPVFDGPDFIGFIIALEDVTVQENIRKQLYMSENLSSIGLLSAGVAHEINNPLEIISNCTSYLKYNIDDPVLNDKIRTIEGEIESISSIISNLVGISHNKREKLEHFNLFKLIDTLQTLLSKSLSTKRITLHLRKSSTEIGVFADITEIKQIFLNLIKNSIESIGSDGNIYIDLLKIDSNNIQISITDDGNGIDENMVNNLFLPFYSTKYDVGKNQGLGLYIIYGIIKKYNGEIEVKNLDKGCCFTIRMPILFDLNKNL